MKDFYLEKVEFEIGKAVETVVDYTELWEEENKTPLAGFILALANHQSQKYIISFRTIYNTNKVIIVSKTPIPQIESYGVKIISTKSLTVANYLTPILHDDIDYFINEDC